MGEVTKEAAAENGEVHMEVGKPDPEIQEEGQLLLAFLQRKLLL